MTRNLTAREMARAADAIERFLADDFELIPTSYTIRLFPADDPLLERSWDLCMETVTIEHRGGFAPVEHLWPGVDPNRPWAICWRGRCWNGDDYEFEPSPSSRDRAFLSRARFSWDGALEQAERARDVARAQIIEWRVP